MSGHSHSRTLSTLPSTRRPMIILRRHFPLHLINNKPDSRIQELFKDVPPLMIPSACDNTRAYLGQMFDIMMGLLVTGDVDSSLATAG